ncbi:aminopeptidase [Clostridium sp. 19966]|uniref:aminopeptidase n=1 Tax=Clostridium sp. 19966 TaxID=2768166 RepID=UPI0028DDC1D8|nr:aminopeptidase [Clostridium sp. 19966]MDT8715189.1 aminopeptidase [Clostridium sp. 19966]
MKNFDEMIKNYAKLVVQTGLNIQPDQTLVIRSSIECSDFVRLAAEAAYDLGAGNVEVIWADAELDRIKMLKAPKEKLGDYPNWLGEAFEINGKKGAAFLSISSANPDLLKGVPNDRVSAFNKGYTDVIQSLLKYTMNNDVPWCVIGVPTKGWAKKVFPDMPVEEAVEKLWEKIFYTTRVDQGDAVEAWKKHIEKNNKNVKFLNEKHFKTLHYKSSTADLNIELDKDHQWCGCGEVSANNIYFVANMPTEEVFTVPKKDGVNGTIKSTKPLVYLGSLINNFTLVFKEGKIIDFSAEVGYEALKNLISTDEGSHYLGEVALVPYDSPISNTGIIFYNTLFDENASCHLAIGKGYPSCIKGGTKMNSEELKLHGVNSSLTHNDFMVGGKDLDIIGETYDGEKIQIFKDGNWAF